MRSALMRASRRSASCAAPHAPSRRAVAPPRAPPIGRALSVGSSGVARRPGAGRRATPLLPTDKARPIGGARGGATARRDGACGAAQEADRREARMSAERIYRLLLRAYPPDFRAENGREMVLLFRDQCRESDARTLGFWAAVICDVARSAPALRAEAWRT